jgi:hypothetical protein
LNKNSGHSLVPWVAVFSVIVAAMFLINPAVRRAVQAKVMALTDYLFWTKGLKNDGSAWQPDQYKGDDTSFVKTKSSQNSANQQLEVKAQGEKGYITNYGSSEATEETVSTSVEDGSQDTLKTFDLNKALP